MTQAVSGANKIVRIVAAALVVVLIVGLVYLLTGGGSKSGTAYFTEAKSVYPGDAIRILGMEVGAIDKLTTEGNRVRVDFHYNSKYSVPADVHAAVLSPTLVATRFIQLDPPYTSGPALQDGGVIPLERTVVPVEFDELKKGLSELADALGPNGVNKDGAINRALTVINKNGMQNGVGQGQPFHDMIVELSKAAKTLSDGRGDLFATVRNLAEFSAVLNKFDAQIVEFDHRLADVSNTLSESDETFRKLLPDIDRVAPTVTRFFKDHADDAVDAVDTAGSVMRTFAQRRDEIAQVLHQGPNTLTNFNNLWHPSFHRLIGNVVLNEPQSFGGPGDALCALMTSAAAADEKTGQEMCVKYLGPVFQHLAVMPPPANLTPGPIEYPRGYTPAYGDLTQGKPNTNGTSHEGTNSDAPRSSTANGNDRSFKGPENIPDNGSGGLFGGLVGGN